MSTNQKTSAYLSLADIAPGTDLFKIIEQTNDKKVETKKDVSAVFVKELGLCDREINLASELFVQTYKDDPWFQFVTSRKQKGSPKLISIIIRYCLSYGRAWGAYDEAGKLLGFSLWQSPHAMKISILDLLKSGLAKLMLTNGLKKTTRFLHSMENRDKFRYSIAKKQKHWFLHGIGVDFSWQRNGIGTSLLAAVFQQADFDQIPVVLIATNAEAPKFFTATGFETVESYNEICSISKQQVCLTTMVRKPRSAAPHRLSLTIKPNTSIFKPPSQVYTPTRRSSISEPSSPTSEDSNGRHFMKGIELGEKLGQGNFSHVFKGTWLESTTVALKYLMDAEEFLHEETLLRSLNHPNIVKYLGIYESLLENEPKIYLVTEWLSEGNLRDLIIKENDALTVVDLLGMARQFAAAMRYLEEMFVIHRDLALRNLLVTKGGNENFIVKIADFGLSVKLDEKVNSITLPNAQIAMRWSSPEIYTDKIFSRASDCWAFGIVLWELFSGGKTPYEGKSNEEARDLILAGEFLTVPNSVPENIAKAMKSCWNVVPSQRPSFKSLFQTIHQQIVQLTTTETASDTLSNSQTTTTTSPSSTLTDYQNVSELQ